MQIKRVPQPSRIAIRRNHRRADRRIGWLILYLLILAVVATGLTAAYGRNWHYDRTRRAVPQMSNTAEIEPGSSAESRDLPGEADDPLFAPGEEKHDSIGDDVIVRIER